MESCHKLKFYSTDDLYSTPLRDVNFEKSCKKRENLYETNLFKNIINSLFTAGLF